MLNKNPGLTVEETLMEGPGLTVKIVLNGKMGPPAEVASNKAAVLADKGELTGLAVGEACIEDSRVAVEEVLIDDL